MVELREELRLALEPRQPLPVVGECRGQHLDRDVAIQSRVARAIHFAHTACAERRQDSQTPRLAPTEGFN